MNPIQLQLTALIEEYEARLERYQMMKFYHQTEEDITYGRSDELDEVINDLMRVRDAVDTPLNDK
jgi:RNA polymerase-interacting CarD/CdnL/TRCF family regulator